MHLSLAFPNKARSYPSGAHFGTSRLVWHVNIMKWQVETNALAYNTAVLIDEEKSFIVKPPGANPIKLFTAEIYGFS